MALILNIESATNVCSVAVAKNGKTLIYKDNLDGQSHARLLTTLISDCLKEINTDLSSLDAIAISKGPGSFTGLRIGVATAKGLCYSLNLPLISVNTLQSMTFKLIQDASFSSDTLFIPMVDARRMEVYTAVLNYQSEFVNETSAKVIDSQSFEKYSKHNKLVFFGDGAVKTKPLLNKGDSTQFIENFQPSATGMVHFSEKSYINNKFESVVYFEPFYLKDFYTPGQLL